MKTFEEILMTKIKELESEENDNKEGVYFMASVAFNEWQSQLKPEPGDKWVRVDGLKVLPKEEVLCTDGLNYMVGRLNEHVNGDIYCEGVDEQLWIITHYEKLTTP